MAPAAFGRLCVETDYRIELKRKNRPAAFGRLCVETVSRTRGIAPMAQPPSGGCVLKLALYRESKRTMLPAAFGRLCVETDGNASNILHLVPAAFGRLCVETMTGIRT